MYSTKKLHLQEQDRISSLTHNVIYHGVQKGGTGLAHLFEVEKLTMNYRMPFYIDAEKIPQVTLEELEIAMNVTFFGARLFRGMKIIDLLNHDKFLEKEGEEER